MTLDDDALSRLKRELKKRGLDVSGLKAVLLQRLKEHLQEEENAEEKPGQKEEEEKASGDKEEAPADPVSNGDEPKEEIQVEVNGGKVEDNSVAIKGVKRAADVEKDEKDTKKQKTEETTVSKPEPEDEDGKPMTTDSGKVDEDSTEAGKKEERTTLRIDNFVRPFTLNAVKALVQEFGNYVEGGFWMDAIKTHCFVTYMNPEITQKTRAALDGKAWPPENGRSLSAKLVDFTAMEVSKYGEENIPSRTKSADSNSAQATQRQKVTIDEFFQKTET
eukprot:jgi/Phyca11/542309/estExt2_Genewise1Plus.C_PHYCAscaffold_90116